MKDKELRELLDRSGFITKSNFTGNLYPGWNPKRHHDKLLEIVDALLDHLGLEYEERTPNIVIKKRKP